LRQGLELGHLRSELEDLLLEVIDTRRQMSMPLVSLASDASGAFGDNQGDDRWANDQIMSRNS
jgi:hypothetical protein